MARRYRYARSASVVAAIPATIRASCGALVCSCGWRSLDSGDKIGRPRGMTGRDSDILFASFASPLLAMTRCGGLRGMTGNAAGWKKIVVILFFYRYKSCIIL